MSSHRMTATIMLCAQRREARTPVQVSQHEPRIGFHPEADAHKQVATLDASAQYASELQHSLATSQAPENA
eukprot:1607819-Prymnesium_polylepis.2